MNIGNGENSFRLYCRYDISMAIFGPIMYYFYLILIYNLSGNFFNPIIFITIRQTLYSKVELE